MGDALLGERIRQASRCEGKRRLDSYGLPMRGNIMAWLTVTYSGTRSCCEEENHDIESHDLHIFFPYDGLSLISRL